MNPAKIQLSPEELLQVQDAGWILTKNQIIEKVYHLFGSLGEGMKIAVNKINLPEEVIQKGPKISRGENYGGLPYVMLDFPRFFSRENVFALRIFFWWGNYFSVTLHLKGTYKKKYGQSIEKNIALLKENNFYVSIGDEEWSHVLDEPHYVLLNALNHNDWLANLSRPSFLKMSAKIDLTEWNTSESRLLFLVEVIVTSLQF